MREENDNNTMLRLNDEIQKLGEVINNEKKIEKKHKKEYLK